LAVGGARYADGGAVPLRARSVQSFHVKDFLHTLDQEFRCGAHEVVELFFDPPFEAVRLNEKIFKVTAYGQGGVRVFPLVKPQLHSLLFSGPPHLGDCQRLLPFLHHRAFRCRFAARFANALGSLRKYSQIEGQ
jgi:hypothetical protein